jgi:hypothetical protein
MLIKRPGSTPSCYVKRFLFSISLTKNTRKESTSGMKFCFCVMVCLLALCFSAFSLNFKPRSREGTQFSKYNVSEKQLAILRYFAEQTFLNPDWDGWWIDSNQDSNAALRYQLSGIAYAAAVLAANTPAYSQPYEEIMLNCIRRLLDVKIWRYIEEFEDFTSQGTFPDPVAYKNIMYSGHLAQVIAMYEDLSGDFEFSQTGWNFTWWNTTAYPNGIPYTTPRLMKAIHNQMAKYFFGGVPCEPQSIFVICNNFPHNAFHIHDKLHGTNFSNTTDAIWQDAVWRFGLTGNAEIGTGQFFNLVFLMFLQWWDPLASEGSDAWALGWMGTWWNEETQATGNHVPTMGYRHMAESKQWSSFSCQQGSGEVGQCCQLMPNPVGEIIFPFPFDITTSFMPMVEAQFFRNFSDAPTRRANCSINLFENLGGFPIDYDGDGVNDAYHYNLTASYADWSTANLLLSFALPSDGSDPGYLKRLFAAVGVPRYKQRSLSPHLIFAEYPTVCVPVAVAGEQALHFELLRGDGQWKRADNRTQLLIGGLRPPLAERTGLFGLELLPRSESLQLYHSIFSPACGWKKRKEKS